MIKWFIKFQAAFIVASISFIVPLQSLHAVIKNVETETTQNEKTTKVISSEPIKEIAPEISVYEVESETIREVSAYNVGDINQTDASPCTSANGENICAALEMGYNRCAANFVPLGSELQIISPNSDWEFQCLVTDRMNSRYSNRVDVAMKLSEKDRAIQFGIQHLNVRILK